MIFRLIFTMTMLLSFNQLIGMTVLCEGNFEIKTEQIGAVNCGEVEIETFECMTLPGLGQTQKGDSKPPLEEDDDDDEKDDYLNGMDDQGSLQSSIRILNNLSNCLSDSGIDGENGEPPECI